MNTIELIAVKNKIADEILTRKNEVLLKTGTAKNTMKQPPCQFSVDELKAEILKSEDNFKNGQYVTMEYMRAKHRPV